MVLIRGSSNAAVVLGHAVNISGGISSGSAAFFFSCFMALTISVCLGGFPFITMGCWVVFQSCSCSWAGADKISPKCSCHLCTCSCHLCTCSSTAIS